MHLMYTFGKYIVYFLIYSLLGAGVETLMRLLVEQRIDGFHGFLHLPLFPIYGFGALLILKLVGTYTRHPVLLFLMGAMVATVLEFVGHWLIEVLFNDKLWDYGGMPFNFEGRVSLYTSVCFGLGAVLLVRYIHPFVKRQVNRISKNMTIIVGMVIGVILLADCVWSVLSRLGMF